MHIAAVIALVTAKEKKECGTFKLEPRPNDYMSSSYALDLIQNRGLTGVFA
jgi:hypothetical protein